MENKVYNATELWQKENSRPSIPSFSLSLDSILGSHGLSLCSVTEVLGLPGTGKTQLCLQLCASIQIPRVLGGLSSEAMYIDTNTNFTIDRFEDIFSSSMRRCRELLGLPFPSKIENGMLKLHYVNAFGLEKFFAFMYTLPKFVEFYKVKLIVIDSITFPLKEGISPKKRTGLLFRLVAELQKLATEKQIAIVLTNEMSTRAGLSGGSIVGALGDAWAHLCNARILLAEVDGVRHAVRMKNNTMPAVAIFQITSDGIRDVE